VLEAAIDAGADDVQSDADGHVITTQFDNLGTVAQALADKLGAAASVKIVWKPNLMTAVDGDKAEQNMKLLQALEEIDDAQAVFSNIEVDDATMARLNAA
jgi:transcriptional/translational regulatory protein YebC/TACO1